METIDFNTVIAENISVVEGLIGTANRLKNGLLSFADYRKTMIKYQMQSDKVYKIADLINGYSYIHIIGVDMYPSVFPFDFYVYNSNGSIEVVGTKSKLIELYIDSNKVLYARVPFGSFSNVHFSGMFMQSCEETNLPSGVSKL